MTTHSSIPAWKITWTKEFSGLQSMESQKVRHDLVTEQQQKHHIPGRIPNGQQPMPLTGSAQQLRARGDDRHLPSGWWVLVSVSTRVM